MIILGCEMGIPPFKETPNMPSKNLFTSTHKAALKTACAMPSALSQGACLFVGWKILNGYTDKVVSW